MSSPRKAPCRNLRSLTPAWPAQGSDQEAGDRKLPALDATGLLVLAVVLLELALLPSRAEPSGLLPGDPLLVIFSPHRFRALFDLAIMVVPVVLFWGTLNGPYLAIRDGAPLGPALQDALVAMGYSAAIVLGAWLVSWLVERWVGPCAGGPPSGLASPWRWW